MDLSHQRTVNYSIYKHTQRRQSTVEQHKLHDTHRLEEAIQILPNQHMPTQLLDQLVDEVVTYKQSSIEPERTAQCVGSEQQVQPREHWVDRVQEMVKPSRDQLLVFWSAHQSGVS